MSSLSDIDIRRELGKNIVIGNYSENCLSPIGYDIRIGAAFSPDRDEEAVFRDGRTVVIGSKQMLQIICKEFVWVSPKILATIHARGSFAVRGLVLNSTTIDPNWSGQMALTLYNFSDNDISLNIGERFATIIFYYCKTPTSSSPNSRAIEGVKTSAFSTYEHSPEISKAKSEFETQKAKAQTSLFFVFSVAKEKIGDSLLRRFGLKTIVFVILMINIVLLFALPMGLYKVLQDTYNLGDYNIAYFFSHLAICVSLLTALLK